MTTELQTNVPENVIDAPENAIDAIEDTTDVPEKTRSAKMVNVGERLKTKRIALEFDERHVANELKITIEQVRALEANQFDYFRSVTFSRGFLKSYCRLLELEAVEIIKAFDDAQMVAEPTIKPINKVNRQTHLGDPIIIVISIVIVAVLVFLVFWWPTTSTDDVARGVKTDIVEVPETENSSKPLKEPESATADSANSASDNSTTRDIAPTSKVSSVTGSTTNDGVVTGLSAETKAILEEAGVNADDVARATEEAEAKDSAPLPQKPTYSDDIVIVFNADCWSEVRDSTGKILYSGVKSAGTRLALTGSAPYRVVLGFAKGVSSLQYKGKAFDFSSFTRQDLARFELK